MDTNRQPQTTFAVLVNHILLTFAAVPSGCLTTSLIYHAEAQDVEIDEVESILSGDLEIQGFVRMSETIRNGHESIEVTFKIADRKQRN